MKTNKLFLLILLLLGMNIGAQAQYELPIGDWAAYMGEVERNEVLEKLFQKAYPMWVDAQKEKGLLNDSGFCFWLL